MAKKPKSSDDESKGISIYTIELSGRQMEKLEQICDQRLWDYYEVDYARFAFKSKIDKVNLVAYKSGKLVVQGKGTEDFVRDTLEAEITGDPRLGYEEFHHPEWFESHAGLDEAGKGDFFGPLVSACVIADGDMVRQWLKAGIRDSKKLTDASVLSREKLIRQTRGVVVRTAFCGMRKYNELMGQPRANLNRLLAWLHARALEDALKTKSVPWGLLDQFSKTPLVQKYYKDKTFDLRMRPKAESDPVVAAASIVARAGYLRQLEKLSDKFGQPLHKGANAKVEGQARRLVGKLGREALGDFAKLHFRTTNIVLGLPLPERGDGGDRGE